jgi:hypothetical protein
MNEHKRWKKRKDGGVAFVYSPKSRTSFRWVSTKKFCNQEPMYPSLSYPKIAKDLIKTVVQFFMTLSFFVSSYAWFQNCGAIFPV